MWVVDVLLCGIIFSLVTSPMNFLYNHSTALMQTQRILTHTLIFVHKLPMKHWQVWAIRPVRPARRRIEQPHRRSGSRKLENSGDSATDRWYCGDYAREYYEGCGERGEIGFVAGQDWYVCCFFLLLMSSSSGVYCWDSFRGDVYAELVIIVYFSLMRFSSFDICLYADYANETCT